MASATSSREVPARHEALAVLVEERGALAADGLGDQEPVPRPLMTQGGGMKLHELQIGQLGAGRLRQREPGADRRWVGRALPEGGHSTGARMVARASTGSTAPLRERATSPTQRPSATVSAVAARGSSTSIRSCSAATADRSG